MPPRVIFTTVQILLILCSGPAVSSVHTFSGQTPSPQASNPFDGYFSELDAVHDVMSSGNEAAFEKLAGSISAMTPTEITAGISVIDRQLDNTAKPQNRWAKPQAVFLLRVISGRPDSAELLASQMDRLTAMLNDPSHSLSGQAAFTLQGVGIRRPDMVKPIFEAALTTPDMNDVGPVIAVILLWMRPHDDDVAEKIAQYMRRPDLTDNQLLDTIIGINNSPVVPDAVTSELVRSLDRPNEVVKSRALVGIARSSPSAKDAARTRVQKMANDPHETAHVRRLAAESLAGEITEDPDTSR